MRTITVFGATGAQGSGVISALKRKGSFAVRALTRNPESAAGIADEVRAADLTRPETLVPALEGSYGVFVNTNSFAAPDTDEIAQGTAAVEAALEAGVEHYVWSTLPDVHAISGGSLSVPHFTDKAAVNEVVSGAGFGSHTFTEPPFYFQNLTSPMYPSPPGPDGTPTWTVPMKPDVRGIHMGDISEYGNLVAGAFEQPDIVGDGSYLSFAGDFLSWDEVIATLRSQGHDIAFQEATDDPWGIRDMFAFFEEHTYFGPQAEQKIELAKQVTVAPFTDFAAWARVNMPA